MSIVSAYDEILEDMECPDCGHVGMDANGGFEYICPNCGYEGSLEEDFEDEDDDDEDDDE